MTALINAITSLRQVNLNIASDNISSLLFYSGRRMGNGASSQNIQAVITSFAVQSMEAFYAAGEYIPPLQFQGSPYGPVSNPERLGDGLED